MGVCERFLFQVGRAYVVGREVAEQTAWYFGVARGDRSASTLVALCAEFAYHHRAELAWSELPDELVELVEARVPLEVLASRLCGRRVHRELHARGLRAFVDLANHVRVVHSRDVVACRCGEPHALELDLPRRAVVEHEPPGRDDDTRPCVTWFFESEAHYFLHVRFRPDRPEGSRVTLGVLHPPSCTDELDECEAWLTTNRAELLAEPNAGEWLCDIPLVVGSPKPLRTPLDARAWTCACI